ncbi:agmatine deiminase family protein [Afipia birgiae]|uniref:agmatine deiminase family protein n=1 Tax=Afipia birgiae TaxID=151414 RepID=UPI0002DFEF4E|nr:agmatine deiminase family protein [Afipia birgiae]
MWKIPPEYEYHRRTWLAWPWDHDIWNGIQGTNLKLCQDSIDRLVRVIANYEDVSIVAMECDLSKLEKRFKRRSSDRYSVEVVPAKYNDVWVRDTFPTFGVESNSLVAICWNFNGWGRRIRHFGSYGDDARLCSKISKLSNARQVDSLITAEGGAFAFDESSSVFTTRSVLLDRSRNPHDTKLELEEKIRQATGRSQVCWLPGDRSEPITSGHIDSVIAFAKNAVLISWVEDESNPEFDVCDYNARTLMSWFREQSLSREIVKISRSSQSNDIDHCLSYTNFACVNGGLIIPRFGNNAEDNYAKASIEEAFENQVRAESVDLTPIAIAGGGIHCVTQQEPFVGTRFEQSSL